MQLLALLLLISLMGCLKQPDVKTSSSSGSVISTCVRSAQAEGLNDPQTIDEAMALILALPKPLDLKCFLQALKRPLVINATSSTASAQPAAGTNNPRIFIFKGDLMISFVPSGAGAAHLEFSEIVANNISIKGELPLPITSSVVMKSPYAGIVNGTATGTTCRGCHGSEAQYTTIDGTPVFQSKAFRPLDSKKVTLTGINQQLYYCDFYTDKTERCEIYRSLLNYGVVNAQDFPATMPTLFDP